MSSNTWISLWLIVFCGVRKYAEDGEMMRLQDWLQFQLVEQHEFCVEEATRKFFAAVATATAKTPGARLLFCHLRELPKLHYRLMGL
eukprot:3421658-Pleurochrysis_carterae.AAC.1